jgi:hypothetical protein
MSRIWPKWTFVGELCPGNQKDESEAGDGDDFNSAKMAMLLVILGFFFFFIQILE